MYLHGRGVSKDGAEAIKWLRSAAEAGDPNGQLNLGLIYLFGMTRSKDTDEAARWLRKSAERGYPAARAALALVQ